MAGKFALLDDYLNVIGIINIPDGLSFVRPHHIPHVLIENDEIAEIGMAYDKENMEFYLPSSPGEETLFSPTHEEESRSINDPPLPENKRHFFSFFRRKK